MDEMINSNRNWRELLWDDIETDSGFDDEFYFASGETEQEADEGLAKEVGTACFRHSRVFSSDVFLLLLLLLCFGGCSVV